MNPTITKGARIGTAGASCVNHLMLRSIVFLALCFSSIGCDALYRLLDKEGAQERDLIGEIVPFEKNVVVEEVQALLHIYGYNTGKVDGVLGLQTRNAVERFQQDNDLEPTRFIDQATWEKLSVFKENELVMGGSLNIRLVQALLKEVGFDSGAIDGKMGTKTRRAIKKFQGAYGLKVDGKVGYQTLSKLATFIPLEPQREQ